MLLARSTNSPPWARTTRLSTMAAIKHAAPLGWRAARPNEKLLLNAVLQALVSQARHMNSTQLEQSTIHLDESAA